MISHLIVIIKKYLVILLYLIVYINICNAQMQLEWARRFNGPLEDGANAICIDNTGNVIVTGGVQIASGFKCVTIKYNKLGDTVWVRDYQRPGNNYNMGNNIKADDSGNVYIAGAESVIKYDKYGNLKWTSYDSTNYTKILLDSLSNVYAAGIGYGKYVVAKYDRNGNRIWVSRRAGANRLHDFAVDKAGNILISGESQYVTTYYDYTTIKYSNNGSLIWVRRYNGLAPPPQANDIPYALTTDNEANVYVTGASQDVNSVFNCVTVKYDSSGNEIWVKRIFPPSNGYAIAVDKLQNVYIASRTLPYNYTTKLDINGNIIWTSTFPTSNLFAPNESVLILDSVNNVYVTANIDSSGNTRYGAIKYDNNGNQLFVVNYHYTSTESNYVYGMVIDNNGCVYLAGESNFAYATVKYSPIITGITENNLVLDKYLLEQNYPNPFNPVTHLRFGISKLGFVSLKVYDALGKEVAALVNEQKSPGSYEVEFDGSNIASGLYFYSLQIDGKIVGTKSMVLLK
jgi:hypothetical protein